MATGTGLPGLTGGNDQVLARPTQVVQMDHAGQAWAQLAKVADNFSDLATNVGVRERRAADSAYLADRQTDIRRQRLELVNQHPEDPTAFDSKFKAFSDGILSNADPRFVPALKATLGEEATSGLSQTLAAKRQRDEELDKKSLTARLTMAEDDVLSTALAGKVGTPEFAQKRQVAADVLGAMHASGFIPPEVIDQKLGELDGRVTAETIISHVQDIYKQKGAKGAFDYLDGEVLRNDKLGGLSPEQRRAYVNKGEADIHQWESERKADLSLAKQDATDLRYQMLAHADVAPDAVDTVAGRLAAAGGAADAARLRRDFLVKGQLDDFARLPVDQQLAKLGSMKGQAADPRLLGGMTKELRSAARDEWTRVQKQIGEGILPDPAQVQNIIKAADTSGDAELLGHISNGLQIADARRQLEGMSPADQARATAALDQKEREGGLNSLDAARLNMARSIAERTATGLREDPFATGVGQRVISAPPPVDWSKPDLYQDLRARDGAAGVVEQHNSLAPIAPFTKQELDGLKAAWDAGDATARTKLLGSLAEGISGERMQATMAKIAPERPVFAWAGGMFHDAPEVARSVVRGETVISADKKSIPSEDNTVRRLLADGLGEAMSQVPKARAAATQAIMARYADLSATAGDLSGTLDTSRFEQSVQDVTGGVVRWNGQKVVAPIRGMNSGTFSDLMDTLTDSEVGDAKTAAGTAVTARDIRRSGNLVDVGDGAYLVKIGGGFAMGDNGKPYVLDLKLIANTRRKDRGDDALPPAQLSDPNNPYATGGVAAGFDPNRPR